MKRRTLIVRTLTGAISATVFTATGWLMGTRTLTMPVPPSPCGGSGPCESVPCNAAICWVFPPSCIEWQCWQQCQTLTTRRWGCHTACECWCYEDYVPGGCGTCNYPCLN